ncbi:MAG: hypothetical protein AMXMBFR25_21290 [Lysobacterales bacterium]|nr:hypothetical protein [Xanthomonadales bacterium]
MGWKDGAPRIKPKEMHTATFDRLRADYWNEGALRAGLIGDMMTRMTARFPGLRL